MRHPGFEPESLAWEARMLTTTPMARVAYHAVIFSVLPDDDDSPKVHIF